MLIKLGRVGQECHIAVTPEFTPASLQPLFLLDGDNYASTSLWQNPSDAWPSVEQAVTTAQPVISSGVVDFDGVDDYMVGGYYNYGALTAQTLPDGAGSDLGKGITGTGLAYDATNDSFWIANHGQAQASDPYTPSVMNVSKDGATKISELVFTTQFPAMQSIQGIAVDTSDNTLWIASKVENLIRHVSKTGADLGAIAVDANPNGLAYDGSNDTLLVLYDNAQVKRYDASSGAYIETVVTLSIPNIDHLYLDEVNNILWVSRGINGESSGVVAYNIDNGVTSNQISLPNSTEIEGIYLDGSRLFVMNNGYFHSGTLNQLQNYPFDNSGIISTVKSAYSAMQFNFVLKIGAIDAASETILALGDPLTGRGFAIYLVGGTNNKIRMMINDGASPIEAVDIACSAALTSYSTIMIRVDFASRAVSLYQNGVYQGAGSYSSAIDNSILYNNLSIAASPDGSRAIDIDFKDICVTNYLLDSSQNNKLGSYYALEHGLSWSNM